MKTCAGDVLMKNISPLCKFSLKGEGGTNSVNRKCNPLRRSCVSCARNAGESAICPARAQPSAEIVRVERAKCRRECDLSGARATLCGDRACRVREMQARVRFGPCPRNPLRRSCVSSARNAGESAIGAVRPQPSAETVRVECAKCAQPSAEIVRVECAKRRRECDWCGPRANLCGDRACRVREMQARVRFGPCPRNPLRRSCVSSARNAGESAICHMPAQPSADIARVECAKCRRDCDFFRYPRNPLRRSCVSSTRNTGESSIGSARGQPSAEIVRVECAKCRRECDLSGPRNSLRRSRVSSARSAGESAIWGAGR